MEALPFLTTDEGGIYSIVSMGEVNGSRVLRTVKAIVQVPALIPAQGTTQDASQDTSQDPAQKTAERTAQGAAQHRIIAWYDDFSE